MTDPVQRSLSSVSFLSRTKKPGKDTTFSLLFSSLLTDRRQQRRASMEMALVLATPHPDLDIHALFAHYNATYFDNALSSCFVQWSSPRFTSSLATCNYQKGCCQITLSQPLLQYLPADHVKNTLLHEMIHAYLFVTKNHRQHNTHGPEFRKIMDSIHVSTKADGQRPPCGYKITLFHDFHDDDEVDDNIANYWKCKKCGDVIKRATVTKPSHADCIVQAHHSTKTCGLNDCRWHWHKVNCGGIYTKQQKLEENHNEKKAVSKGLMRLLGEVSLENVIPENDKYVTTSSKEFSASSVKGDSSATFQIITYQRNLKGTSRSKLGSGEINTKPDIQGPLNDRRSPEANMPDKHKSATGLNKEIMRFSPSSVNPHKISQPRSLRNWFPRAKQEAFLQNAEESSRTRKLGDKKSDLKGLSYPITSKPPAVKGRTYVRDTQKEATLCQVSPYSAKQFSKIERQRSAPHEETHCRKTESSFPEIEKSEQNFIILANQKSKVSEKKVETKVQTTREVTRFIPSESKSYTSPMKVDAHRKPGSSPPNMLESSRKRKLTKKEYISQANCNYKVASKWLDYYEDESTDEEIKPLLNRKIIRNKRMKILRESIMREKEKQERKLRETMEIKLLCLPGFSPDNVVDISDDDSS